VKRYCRDLEEAVIRTLAALGLSGERIPGLTGVWLTSPPRKVCSIGVHISRWVTTHGYALNVDLDPAPFTTWITACGLEDAAFTTVTRELGTPVPVDAVRALAVDAIAEVFSLALDELPAEDGAGLWPQPTHAAIAARARGGEALVG
jgi:lipoyl(octanoyl) transferase